MAIIGIDLGTTNSLVSVWKDGKAILIPNSLGKALTPSVVSIRDEEIIVGQIAKERMISHPERTVGSFKRYMGINKVFRIGGKVFTPEDLSSFVIRQLKEDAEAYLKEPVTEAVISVPAYFNDHQRLATKLAGQLAGLTVERIINEPSAASIAYQTKFDVDQLFLVFDLGGGTLDISLVEAFENIVEITAVSGDNRLGGDDFNEAIVQGFYELYPELKFMLSATEQASLLRQAEQCKIALSEMKLACLVFEHEGKKYEMPLDHNKLVALCGTLFGRIRAVLGKVLKDAGKRVSDLDDIIMVGGSSKMLSIQQYLEHLTGKKPLCNIDPDKAVGIGAGIVSGIKDRESSIKDMILTDICPFSLGTAVLNEQNNGLVFSPIIERNTYLPVSKMQIYTTVRDYQTHLTVNIYQGESLQVEENLLLRELSVDVPPDLAGKVQILVRMTYDINGVLEVEITCLQSGEKQNQIIVSNDKLSQEEINRRVDELQKLKTPIHEQDDVRLLLARGERLYAENSGPIREVILQHLNVLERALNANDLIQIEKTKRKISSVFDKLEISDVGFLDEPEEEEEDGEEPQWRYSDFDRNDF